MDGGDVSDETGKVLPFRPRKAASPQVARGPSASITEEGRLLYLMEGRLAVAMEALRSIQVNTEREIGGQEDAEMLLVRVAQEADVALRLLVNPVTWRDGGGRPVRIQFLPTSRGVQLLLMEFSPALDSIDRVQVGRAFEALGEWVGLAIDRCGGGRASFARDQASLLAALRERARVSMPGYAVEFIEMPSGGR
jgi:hypothetical protein